MTMYFRLSEQAQRHLQGSEHFEDILMGANRPTLVVQRFQEIYSQERIEAYDSIADIDGTDLNMSIPTFLLDILKVYSHIHYVIIIIINFSIATVQLNAH